jgi:hypothetical protein
MWTIGPNETSWSEFQQGKTDSGASSVDGRPILADPLGNVPMKIYEIRTDEVEEIAKGTVLLLGRSAGTGKTICFCNRMDYDRQRMAHNPASLS